MPVALAAIPGALEESLVDAVARSRFVTIVQHGYAHRNHAPPEERKMELGMHRGAEPRSWSSRAVAIRCGGAFGERFAAGARPAVEPDRDAIVARLPDIGFRGLSTFGPRKAPFSAPGLVQCNTHVDLIAWQRDRAFIGAEAAIDRFVAHLRMRRDGSADADADEPTGLLTHHLDMSDACWEFVAELVARTRERRRRVGRRRDRVRLGRFRGAYFRPISMKRT